MQHLRGAVQIVRPDQPDKAVAQVFAFQQHEDHHHDHQTGSGNRADQRQHKVLQHLHGRAALYHLNGHRQGWRVGSGLGHRSPDFGVDGRHHLGHPRDNASAIPRLLQVVQFGHDIGLKFGQVHRKLAHLCGHDQQEYPDHRKGQRHHGKDGGQHRQPLVAQITYQRRQRKGDQHGNRQRQEHILAKVQNRRHDGNGRQGRQGDATVGKAVIDHRSLRWIALVCHICPRN